MKPKNPDRRTFVQAGSALLGMGLPLQRAASAADATLPARPDAVFVPPERLQEHLTKLFGDTPVQTGRVALNLPALAENGNSVALGINAEPDTNNLPPGKLYLFAEKNPLPDIARFTTDATLTGGLDIATRIRLSDSQRIIAIARYSDGTLFAGEASIIVTLAACIDLPT